MHDPEIHILSTKPLSDDLLEKAAAHNIRVDVTPFIHIALSSPEKFASWLSLTDESYAIFTSSHAVEAVAAWADAVSANWKVFCLGGATLAAVNALLPNTFVVSTASSASELAEVITQSDVQKLTYFCGNLRRDELPVYLSLKGVDVEEVVVYTTLLSSVKLPVSYHGIMFFSPSGVESYLMENEMGKDTVLFAIGNTTAASLSRFDNTLIVGDHPSPEALINKIISHFQMVDKK